MSANGEKRISFLARQRNMIVAVLIILAILTAGYFIVIRPLTVQKPANSGTPSEINLLPGEVKQQNNILIFEKIDREKIKEVKIHNPKNASFGEKYVDWGFKVVAETDEETKEVNHSLYLTGYEYAPTEATLEAYLVTGAGYSLVSSRVEEHCTDFSKYGLEKSGGDNDADAVYYTIETTDGKIYKLYIGNKIPSGAGYYVRSGDTVTDENGNTYVRDSVYIVSATTLDYSILATPMVAVQPMLTYPLQQMSGAIFGAFSLTDNDGSLDIMFLPVDTKAQDPFINFSALATYEAVTPAGYYASDTFDALTEVFAKLSGLEVVELASLMTLTDKETGEEYEEYYFAEDVFAKYGLTEPRYSLYFNNNGVDSAVYFSDVQKDGYMYAYSLVFNTICKVDPVSVYFLEWDTYQFIQSEVFRMNVNDCGRIEVSGKFGGQSVSEAFEITGKDKELLVKCLTSPDKTIDVNNFRYYYQVLLQTCVQDEIPSDIDVEKLTKGDPYATISITTRRIVVFKKDENGKDTGKLDYVLEPVTRVYRFYQYTNGRALCTIESIDENGNSLGESGKFYVRVYKLDKILSDTLKVRDNIDVDKRERE